jgi:hypothetical protein
VDADRQFFKSCLGLPEPWSSQRGTPLSHSFCQHAVASREPLIVADSREHELLRDNRAIRDIGVIAYAGIPLIDAAGHALGTLCVIDSQPRHWTTDQIQLLSDLAASVVTEIASPRRRRRPRTAHSLGASGDPCAGRLAGVAAGMESSTRAPALVARRSSGRTRAWQQGRLRPHLGLLLAAGASSTSSKASSTIDPRHSSRPRPLSAARSAGTSDFLAFGVVLIVVGSGLARSGARRA